jgi:pyruvate kinase
MGRTKIVCTIGPATKTKTQLKRLMQAGMNVARLNFSHGKHEEHAQVVKNVRQAAKETKQNIAILQDLQGSRIRVGDIGENPIMLKKGQKVIFTTGKVADKANKIPVTYKNLHLDIKANERILLVDGLIEVKVDKVLGNDIYSTVKVGGQLETHKGINLPDTKLSIPSLTEKDKKDILFGVKHDVDFIALSFARQARDIVILRKLISQAEKKLKKKPRYPINIIVKVERREAIDNLDEILSVSDGIMVARGDLGIEMPAEDIPLLQKMIIDKCLDYAKPVIVATQMLDSMIHNQRPTRAEVSDVANAVIDHADALMLSAETAVGKYPIEAVKYMTRIIEKTEASSYDDLQVSVLPEKRLAPEQAVSKIAKIFTTSTNAKLILSTSLSGKTGRIVSSYRPELLHFVACTDDRIMRQLVLSWGVVPFVLPPVDTIDSLLKKAILSLKEKKLIKQKDTIIIIAGEPVGRSGKINIVEIKKIEEI